MDRATVVAGEAEQSWEERRRGEGQGASVVVRGRKGEGEKGVWGKLT
jgi:hypothetical protein